MAKRVYLVASSWYDIGFNHEKDVGEIDDYLWLEDYPEDVTNETLVNAVHDVLHDNNSSIIDDFVYEAIDVSIEVRDE